MKIGIVGLGLIGGSFAHAFKKYTTHCVYVADREAAITARAIADGNAVGVLSDETINECDAVIIALYPQATLDYVREKIAHFRRGALIIDAAGVKQIIGATLTPLAEKYGVRFVGGHPMAGSEQSGYAAATADLFVNASMIFCDENFADEKNLSPSLRTDLENLFLPLGFTQLKFTTPEQHDKIIAYTSQLAHLVSNAYIKSPTAQQRDGFSAGSFRDLTRVAQLNVKMWTELFLANRQNLVAELDILIAELKKYRVALQASDANELRELLAIGSALKAADATNHP